MNLHRYLDSLRLPRFMKWMGVGGIVFAGCASGAPGDLDLTFNGTGTAQTNVSPTSEDDAATCVAIQPDGKIVLAGRTGSTRKFALVRYLPNGALDTSFDGDGKVITALGTSHAECAAMTLQPDGKIVLVGYARGAADNDFALARYNTDGSLDSGFGIAGKVMVPVGSLDDGATCVALDGGEIIVGGNSRVGSNLVFSLARFNPNGTLRTSWGFAGVIMTPVGTASATAKGIAIQPDGKILLAGSASSDSTWSDFAAVRYESNGALDPTFGTGGKTVIPISPSNLNEYGNSLALQPDGKILIAGESFPSSTVIRCLSDGSLDPSFGTGGKSSFTSGGSPYYAQSVALQADGRILVGGRFGSMARFKADGTLDASYGGSGIGGGGEAFAIQADGKIVCAGNANGDFLASRREALDHLEQWRQTYFGSYVPTGDRHDESDPDRDGQANLLEYSFGNNPLSPASSQSPTWQMSAGQYVTSFSQPAGVTGITYRAHWSSTLNPLDWQPITDTGTLPQHGFSVPMAGKTRVFVRLTVTRP